MSVLVSFRDFFVETAPRAPPPRGQEVRTALSYYGTCVVQRWPCVYLPLNRGEN